MAPEMEGEEEADPMEEADLVVEDLMEEVDLVVEDPMEVAVVENLVEELKAAVA